MSLTTVLSAQVTMWTLYRPDVILAMPSHVIMVGIDVRPWLMCAMITSVVMEAAAL